jgi:hypothetical protein
MKKSAKLLILGLIAYHAAFTQSDERFYFPSKKLEKIDSLPHENLAFTIEKDTLTGIFIKPKTTAKASVLYFHGAGGNLTTYINFIKPLVESEFQVILIDFRGYGKSTGKPSHLNIASDAQIIFDQLLKREDIKSTKIIVYGASMGTQVATNLTKNNQSKIKALVLDGALSSFTDLAVESAPKPMKRMIRKHLISPYSAKDDIKQIKDVELLIIHSKEDKSIPFKEAETVFANANGPKSFWVYEGDHLEAPIRLPKDFVDKFNQLLL